MPLEDMGSEKEFDLELIGNLGRFKTAGSYPVDFFMTSMSLPRAVNELSFARDVQMKDVDFDLMMQRDIDEERVENEIIRYLQPDEENGASSPVFFPPLLAAIVPVSEKVIQLFYGECVESDHLPSDNFKGYKWNHNFQVYGRSSNGLDALPLLPREGAESIKSNQAVLELRTQKNNSKGVALIVIDGQHRLMALKKMYERAPKKVSDIVVPICILYPPNSSSGCDQATTPNVPRVFRSLFVDVNATMKTVGAHFNILLSDKSISDLACRVFCDNAINKNTPEPLLPAIEWNIKDPKRAYIINREYSITSIGVIKKALDESFKADYLTNYVLDIHSDDAQLFPPESDEFDFFSSIKWSSFSYAQSNVLKEKVGFFLSPFLEKLFFHKKPYSDLWGVISEEISSIRVKSMRDDIEGVCAKTVIDFIENYRPISDDDTRSKVLLKDFESIIKTKRFRLGLDILRYALFQRALINVSSLFFKVFYKLSLSTSSAQDCFFVFLEEIFSNKKQFDSKNSFMQYTVFEALKIRARDDTKNSLQLLMLSNLARSDIREKIIESLDLEVVPGEVAEELEVILLKLGVDSAGEFLYKFRREREKAFKKTYAVDFSSLTDDEREELRVSEEIQKRDENKVKDGKIEASFAKKPFDDLVKKHVSRFTLQAKQDFRSVLRIKADFLEHEDNFNDENGNTDA